MIKSATTVMRFVPESEKQMFYDFTKEDSKATTDKNEKKFLTEARISYFYGCKVLMFFIDGSPAGFIAYQQCKDSYMNIYFVYTSPKFRGRGIQKMLINAAIEHEEPCRIYSLASTIHSIILYSKMGFKFWGETMKGELVMDHQMWKSADQPVKALKALKKNGINKPQTISDISSLTEDEITDCIVRLHPDYL